MSLEFSTSNMMEMDKGRVNVGKRLLEPSKYLLITSSLNDISIIRHEYAFRQVSNCDDGGRSMLMAHWWVLKDFITFYAIRRVF